LFNISNNIVFKTFSQLKELLPREYRFQASVVFFLLIISSIIEFLGLALLVPLFTIVVDFDSISKIHFLEYIYSAFNFTSAKSFSVFLALSIGVVFIIKNLLLLAINHYQIKFTFRLFNFYSIKSLEYYFSKGYLYVKSSDANTIVRNIALLPKLFNRNFVIPYLNLLNDLFIISIIIIILIFQNPLFVVILLSILLPFFLLFYFLIRKRIQRLEKFDLSIQPKISRTIFQVINGYLDTLVNNAFDKLNKRNSKFIHESSDNGVELLTLKSSPQKMVELAMVFSLITIVCFGLYYFDDSSKLVTALAFFGIAAFRIMPSINRMLISLVTIKGYDYVYEYLKPVSDFAKSQEINTNADTLTFNSKIEFENISFSYNANEVVFSDFSFQINKHQTVGIIGPSGSGKSTLMLLMLGVIFPDKGKVTIDDRLLTPETANQWHKLVGIVPQEVFIIDGSIKENITLSNDENEIDFEALNKAIELSSLNDFIKHQPNGVNSILDDKGANLSGGQKQRIAIARAVYNGSQVIVFDEATSALDIETEKEIKNSILTLQKEGFTVVIIAHRYTTLAHCDNIIEINKNSFTIISKEELKSRMNDLL
jgi:ATP-binding cassette, subfamily B, bacterial PglK